jgi:hypothetical protein
MKYKTQVIQASTKEKTEALEKIGKAIENLELEDVLNIFAGTLIHTAQANGLPREQLLEFIRKASVSIYEVN